MIDVNSHNFEIEVLGEKKPVLLCFLSKKSEEYVKIQQLLEEVEHELLDSVKIFKIDVDEAFKLAMKYQIFDIPSYVLMQYGIYQKRIYGIETKEEILNFIE